MKGRLLLVLKDLDEIIETQQNKLDVDRKLYEQRKANGCAFSKSCKNPVAKGRTMCFKHLIKASEYARKHRVMR